MRNVALAANWSKISFSWWSKIIKTKAEINKNYIQIEIFKTNKNDKRLNLKLKLKLKI